MRAMSSDRAPPASAACPVAISAASARSRSSGRGRAARAVDCGGQIGAPAIARPSRRVSGREPAHHGCNRARRREPVARPGNPAPSSAGVLPACSSRMRSAAGSGRDAQPSPSTSRIVPGTDRRWPVVVSTAIAAGSAAVPVERRGRPCGQGCRPRIWLWMTAAGLAQSTSRRPSSAGGVGGRAVVLRALGTAARREPIDASHEQPRADRREPRSTSSLVSSGPIGVSHVASIGPASSAFTTRMIVTPVSRSPAITARWTGAAPR